MISEKAAEHIRCHGINSTSFQTLYPGYRYFMIVIEGETGIIAYVDTPTAWIGASEPVVSKENLGYFLEAFRDAAKWARKTAAILPVSAIVAEEARKLNFYAIQVGSEPWYKLENERTQASAKQLSKKGAIVQSFDLTTISVTEKLELDELTERWLGSRKMANLSFLNRVEPWHLFHEKRYFRIIFRKKQIAYIAAVPIQARNAWYFVDIIRDPESPTGTTELLILEAAKALKLEGAKEFTLGMSPFVEPSPDEQKVHPLSYRGFSYLFNNLETFYGFKSLLQYKQKFDADRWEPQYLISLEKSLGVRTLFGLNRAIFPKGILHTGFSTTRRLFGKFNLSALYQKYLNDRMMPKSPPQDFFAYWGRCKITTTAILLSLLYFFTSTDEHFHIRPNMVQRYSYSLENLFYGNSPTRGFIDLIIASFLHWDIVHLGTNILVAAIFMSFLECVAGSTVTFISFFAGIIFSNPLTSAIFSAILYVIAPSKLNHFLHEPDIGCSLGIFACIGVLSVLVKKPVILLGLFSLATLVYNVEIHSFLGYNHLIALLIGYLIGTRYVLKT
jgi:membrane associated rhomboid family serine protease